MGDWKKPIPVSILRRLTKLFVANLPDRCSGNDLAGVLRSFGTIYDIYIAKKREKGGTRFGFVSFLDVKDVGDLVRSTSSLKMGYYKLNTNVARYVLEEGEINDWRPERPRTEIRSERPRTDNVKQGNEEQHVRYEKKGLLSFQEALTGKRNSPAPSTKTLYVEDSLVVFESLHGRSLIVRVFSFDVLRNFKPVLKEMGLASGAIRYLGGMQFVISFKTGEQAIMARDEIRGRSEEFESVEIWDGNEIAFERLAWVKIEGLPLQVLSNDVLNNIANMFGKVVRKAQHDFDDADVSHYYVGILVEEGRRVNGEVSVVWKDKIFLLWVTEDSGDWCRHFLDPDDKSLEHVEEATGIENSNVEDSTTNMEDSPRNIASEKEDVSPEKDVGPTEGVTEEFLENINEGEVGKGGPDALEKEGSVLGDENLDVGSNSLNRLAPTDGNFLAKKQKKFRRAKSSVRRKNKAHTNDSSPGSGNRPKKRSRLEDDDPFDIDRLIGIFKPVETRVREDDRNSDGRNIDLNVQACSDMDNMALQSSGTDSPLMEGGSCSPSAGDVVTPSNFHCGVLPRGV